MKCPYCDQEHTDDSRFCPNTGKLLLPAAEQTPAEIRQAVQGEEQWVRQEEVLQEKQPVQEILPSNVPSTTPASIAQAVSPVQKPRRRSALPRIAFGCVGVPLVLLLLLALFIFIDPIHLHVWGRINGSYDAAAEIMPADTSLYLGINIGNAILTRIDRVWAPFMPTGASNQSSSGFEYSQISPANARLVTPFDDLFQQILSETGIRVPDDLTPWIGQYGGIGIVDFEDSGYGSPVPTGYVIAVEARNISRADAFLETLAANVSDIQDTTFVPQVYRGVRMFVQQVGNGEMALSFGRSGRMLLLATDVSILKGVIDGQGNQGLSGVKDYSSLIAQRSINWSASLFLSPQLFDSLSAEMLQSAGASLATPLVTPFSAINSTGILLNASAFYNGLRLDMYTNYDVTSKSTADINQLQSWYATPEQVIKMLPDNTVIYIANSKFDLFMQTILDAALTDESLRSSFYDGFTETFGFSLQDDLLSHLNGQWAIYVVPSKNGSLPEQANVNLAISLITQTDNNLDLQTISDKMNNWGPYTGFTIDTQKQEGVTYFQLNSSGGFPLNVVTFGQNNGYFTMGTDMNTLASTFTHDTLLVNLASYKNAVGMMPNGMQPSVYIDIGRLIADMREGMPADEIESFNNSLGELQHLSLVASGSEMKQPGIARTSIVLMISDK